MTLPTDRRPLVLIYWSFIATTALAAAIVAATFWFSAKGRDDNAWVSHTLEVRDQIDQTGALVRSGEAGERGYLLTGDDRYLAPYEDATRRLPPALEALGQLISDNPRQVTAMAQLRGLVSDRLALLRRGVELRKGGNSQAAVAQVGAGAGLRLMDEIGTTLAGMTAEESRLLEPAAGDRGHIDTAGSARRGGRVPPDRCRRRPRLPLHAAILSRAVGGA